MVRGLAPITKHADSPNLDLLRAAAVLLVLVDHTAGFFVADANLQRELGWLGGLGVAFFFVHTSAVLMMSLERSRLRGWAMAKAFYARRAFRIYPLSCALVLFVFFTGIPQHALRNHAATAAPRTALVLFSNFTLTQNFSGQPNLLGQLWSLPVELDMYLLLPLLFVLTMKYPRKFRWLAWPISVLVALALPHVPVARGFAPVLRFSPMFIPGILAFNLSKIQPRLPSWLWPMTIGTMVAVFMVFQRWEIGWLVCLVLGCTVLVFREQTNRAVNWITHTIAKYSYGIYLTHSLAIWVAFVYLAGSSLYLRVIVFAGSSALLPFVLFHAIEKPGIESGRRIVEMRRAAVTSSQAAAMGANS
jgi:peptidoglycan/LPS O-acetylase OafA/YrhL